MLLLDSLLFSIFVLKMDRVEKDLARNCFPCLASTGTLKSKQKISLKIISKISIHSLK
jgi:hypothetical protein